MISLTEKQFKVLYCLSTFHFLTFKQLEACGIAHIKSLRKDIVPKLIRANFVKEQRFGTLPEFGQLSRIHYLTPKGAEIVAEGANLTLESIYLPKGVFFRRDYWHRLAYIDSKIKAYQWAGLKGYGVTWVDDYQHEGGNHQKGRRQVSKTQITLNDGTNIKPDGLFTLLQPNGNAVACVLELHRGKDSQRTTDQLRLNVQAIQEGHYQDRLGVDYEKGAFLFSVHDGETLEATKRRMREALPPSLVPLVLFNQTETLQEHGFAHGWTHCDGSTPKLFKG